MKALSLTAWCIALVIACAVAAPTAYANPATTPEPAYALPQEQVALLTQWYARVGPRKPNETVGELAVRAAEQQLGKTYFDPPSQMGPEELRINLDTFQCVSLVESSLALARCIWQQSANESCFAKEIVDTRYRGGVINGFASRMHYFAEWLTDNTARGRFVELTSDLGGTKSAHDLFYMTRHAKKYPPLGDATVLSSIAAMEKELSKTEFSTLAREQLAKAQNELQTGDVIAIVTSKPGLLISHTGFVSRQKGGAPRLLHASSHQKKVVLTGDIASYVNRWPDRRGIMVVRPVPPAAQTAAQP